MPGCECGRPQGQCIKGDMDYCPNELDFDNEYDDEEESDGSEDCGRWRDGELSYQCSKAGSEECDWECPIGLPSRAGLRRRNTKSA